MAGARSVVIPVDARRLQFLIAPKAGDHDEVGDENTRFSANRFFSFVDLPCGRLRIADLAFEYLDRHWAAIGGAQEPEGGSSGRSSRPSRL